MVSRMGIGEVPPTIGYEWAGTTGSIAVEGAQKMATIDRFNNLIRNVVPDETSRDVEELRKLIDI